jgi:type II secretory pathway pseudopilin PulG
MFRCPECDAAINQASEICPRCGSDLAALVEAALAAEPSKRRSLPRLLATWGAVAGVIALGLYLFVWFVLPEYSSTEPARRSEARAEQAIRAMRTSLEVYARANGGNYPTSVEALGVAGRAPVQAGLEAGYTLAYAPGMPDPGGSVRTYTLQARPARYGLRSYFTDQSGVIHATRENRPATPQDPVL